MRFLDLYVNNRTWSLGTMKVNSFKKHGQHRALVEPYITPCGEDAKLLSFPGQVVLIRLSKLQKRERPIFPISKARFPELVLGRDGDRRLK